MYQSLYSVIQACIGMNVNQVFDIVENLCKWFISRYDFLSNVSYLIISPLHVDSLCSSSSSISKVGLL